MGSDGDRKAAKPADGELLRRVLDRLDQLEQAVERNAAGHGGRGADVVASLEPWLQKIEDAAMGALDVEQLEAALTTLADHQEAVTGWIQQLAAQLTSQLAAGQDELRSLLTAEGGFRVQQAHLAEVRDRLAAVAAEIASGRRADTDAVVAAVERATLRPIAQLQASVERLSAEVERMRASLAELQAGAV